MSFINTHLFSNFNKSDTIHTSVRRRAVQGGKTFILPFALILVFVMLPTTIRADRLTATYNGRAISKIIVSGNTVTKKYVITRELLFTVGDRYNDSLSELSEKRIYNTYLFNNVEIIPVPDNDAIALIVQVTERWFYYPFPVLRFEDRDYSKITYGAGLIDVNAMGENINLIGSVFFGNRPGYQFEFYNPWFGMEQRYSFGFSINQYFLPSKYAINHPTGDFDERHFNILSTFGRYWNRYFYNTAIFMFNHVTVPGTVASFMPNQQKKLDVFGAGLSTTFDNRDLIAYPSSGWFAEFTLMAQGIGNKYVNYQQAVADIRHYKTVRGITIAARAYTRQTRGKLPLYDGVYIGFLERIRGHFNEVYEGTNSIILSLETRFTLLPLRQISVSNGFLSPSATQNLSYGLNAALFFDSGQVWGNGKNLRLSDFVSGFGAGLHFRLPYIEVVRIEMGFDEQLRHEFIFEAQTAF